MKLQSELYPSREVVLCLDPYCGLGFVLWCMSRSVHALNEAFVLFACKLFLVCLFPYLSNLKSVFN